MKYVLFYFEIKRKLCIVWTMFSWTRWVSNDSMFTGLNLTHHLNVHRFVVFYCPLASPQNHSPCCSTMCCRMKVVHSRFHEEEHWISSECQVFDLALFVVARLVGLSVQNVSTDVVWSAALQQRSQALSRRQEGAADVFGVILARAVARLSFLTQRPDVRKGGRGHRPQPHRFISRGR